VCDAPLPPTSELRTRHELAKRDPHLLSDHRVTWALRNRNKNGLSACRAAFESPCGELLVRDPAFLAWFLGRSVIVICDRRWNNGRAAAGHAYEAEALRVERY
jgi:hypothetical protein